MSAAGVGKAPAASVQVNVAPSEGSSATGDTAKFRTPPSERKINTQLNYQHVDVDRDSDDDASCNEEVAAPAKKKSNKASDVLQSCRSAKKATRKAEKNDSPSGIDEYKRRVCVC